VRGLRLLLAVFAGFVLGPAAETAGAAVYAPEYGTDPDLVAGYERQPEGSLAPLQGSPFAVVAPSAPVGGIVSLAFTPDGGRAVSGFLYSGGVQGIAVGANGSMTPAGAPLSSASSTDDAVSPDGRFAYSSTREFLATPAQGIRAYSISASGSLVSLGPGTSNDEYNSLAITPDGRFLYASSGTGVTRFAVGGDGKLTDLGPTGAPGAYVVSPSPDGGLLFVGSGNGAGAKLHSFSIASDGTLSENGVPVPVGAIGVYYLGVAPDGRHVYVPDATNDAIVTIGVAADGRLALVRSTPLTDPESLAVSPDGRFLYYPHSGSPATIGVASLGPDGVPAALPFEAPWKSGEPERLVFQPQPAPVARFSAAPAAPGAMSVFDARPSVRAARFDWDFGDGSGLADGGPTPHHRYARAGIYTVKLTVTDANGCSARQIYTGQTTVCPGGTLVTATSALDTPPAITGLSLTHRRFAVASAKAPVVRRGTAFRYTLSEAARIRIRIERRKRRKRGGKVRFRSLGSVRAKGRSGRNRTPFNGRLRGRKLKPGAYRATAVATDSAGGRSKPRRVGFRVVAAGG
jgi:DNA-binding beta-propeller fold protein YncE